MNVDELLKISEIFLKSAQQKIGAGIFFICTDDNTALLIKRSDKVDEPGTWGISGGGLEAGEKPFDAAVRETNEELHSFPQRYTLVDKMIQDSKKGKYHIFVMDIPEDEKRIWTSTIKLNYESSQHRWFRISNMPNNLHSAINIIQT